MFAKEKAMKTIRTKNNMKTLDQFITEEYGKIGTKKRDKFEQGYKAFKKSILIKNLKR